MKASTSDGLACQLKEANRVASGWMLANHLDLNLSPS